MFWRLNCDMNWYHRRCFSVDVAFYNYYVTMLREPMISNVVKNSWGWNFAKFSDLVLIFPPKVFYKKGAKSFAIFIGKHLCQNLFLSCSSIRKETLAQSFHVNFARFLRAPFLHNRSGWLLLFYNICWLCTLQLYVTGNFQVVTSH